MRTDGMGAIQSKPCILVRRRLGFVEHTKLELPIDLDTRCIGKKRGEDESCFKGNCVPIDVQCDETGCHEPVTPPGSGGGGMGGSGAGPSSGGAGGDGGSPGVGGGIVVIGGSPSVGLCDDLAACEATTTAICPLSCSTGLGHFCDADECECRVCTSAMAINCPGEALWNAGGTCTCCGIE